MGALTFDDVTACLVTRGDVDLQPILETLPYPNVVVWDNSKRPRDLKTYGRFAAIREASTDVVFVQDDDCVFRHHADLLAEYESGVLVANWGHGADPDGLEDIALYHGGAIFDRDLPEQAFRRYLERWPADDSMLYEADFIFGCLTPHRHVVLPFEIRDVAYNGRRMCDQPWQRDLKHEVTDRCRAIRDGVEAVAA